MFRFTEIINRVIRKTDWYNNDVFSNGLNFQSISSSDYDVINFGSTSALNAFDYSKEKIRAKNLALRSNPLYGDCILVKKFAKRIRKGGYLIISLCPFSSLSGSYKDLDDTYYALLSPEHIPNFSLKRYLKINDIKKHPYKYFPLFYFFSYFLKLICKFDKNTEGKMVSDGRKWLEMWEREFHITDLNKPFSPRNSKGIKDAAQILNEIIDFCRSLDIYPVVVIPPVYHTLGELFTTEKKRLIINPLIDSLKDKDVWFHNYMDDIDFSNDISLFQNSFLMNSKGAKLFTKRVISDIKVYENRNIDTATSL